MRKRWRRSRAPWSDSTRRRAPGYLADLAVLSQDVLDEAAVPAQDLPKTRSLLTVIGGDVVWHDPAF
ncbi:hypothetical protein FQY83_12630 [Luteimonas marina]|uniref:Amidohydrolase family protein n=1 Tax=Luteimonas marina TaxID=488485 RepID=A0A5C5U087_9GAMM|nr:hypothetical protein [Luteimonas marina]TWT19199.1 hypothetical protein FQY83_12630 [Luteimonas marina]